MWKPKIKIEAA